MKILPVTLFLSLFTFSFGFAQQFALYNSGTLFDSFENPAQKAFIPDSSKKYAFNFLIPTLGINAVAAGPAQSSLKAFIFGQAANLPEPELGQGQTNEVHFNSNAYLAMFRIFKDVKYHKELGFSWQVRNDGYARVTNETLAIFKNPELFQVDQHSNPFNNRGDNQSFHQFSFTYRENFNKRLGLGIKLSYLSGISYNQLYIKSSAITVNQSENSLNLNLNGKYRSSFAYEEMNPKMVMPGFENPGIAITLGAAYSLKNKWYLAGNLKDIGFIRWKNDSYSYVFNRPLTISTASNSGIYTQLYREISTSLAQDFQQKGFATLINGRAELLVNKNLGNYQPHLLLSKSLLFPSADIAFINNLRHKNSIFSLSTTYNTGKFFQVGGHYMLKTPNFEFFLGSEQLFKTYNFTRVYLSNNADFGKGYTGASFYFGFAVKYGSPMQRRANATLIPGIGSNADDRPGFFKRIFAKKNR